jgi:hypothetical protein
MDNHQPKPELDASGSASAFMDMFKTLLNKELGREEPNETTEATEDDEGEAKPEENEEETIEDSYEKFKFKENHRYFTDYM